MIAYCRMNEPGGVSIGVIGHSRMIVPRSCRVIRVVLPQGHDIFPSYCEGEGGLMTTVPVGLRMVNIAEHLEQ